MTNLFANLLHGHAPTGGARELLFSFVVVLTAILTGAPSLSPRWPRAWNPSSPPGPWDLDF